MPNPGQSQLNKRSDTLSRLTQSHWKVRAKILSSQCVGSMVPCLCIRP